MFPGVKCVASRGDSRAERALLQSAPFPTVPHNRTRLVMEIVFNCTNCKQELAVEESAIGLETECPSCREVQLVPDPKTAKGWAHYEQPAPPPQSADDRSSTPENQSQADKGWARYLGLILGAFVAIIFIIFVILPTPNDTTNLHIFAAGSEKGAAARVGFQQLGYKPSPEGIDEFARKDCPSSLSGNEREDWIKGYKSGFGY